MVKSITFILFFFFFFFFFFFVCLFFVLFFLFDRWVGSSLIAVNQPGVLKQVIFKARPLAMGWAVQSWKGLLSRSVRLPNSPYCFVLKESDHIEPIRLCAGPQLQLPVFPGFLYDLHMCAFCDYVLLIKMTCALNWIIGRKRHAESTSLSRPDLVESRGKTVSGQLELSPDAVDDQDFCCALSCSPCSTTCCCIAVWAVKS